MLTNQIVLFQHSVTMLHLNLFMTSAPVLDSTKQKSVANFCK